MQKKGYRNKKRKGVASAIGILFMVGILMTSVLPMFMYVNQVNNYYDTTVVEMKTADDEKSMENLEVLAFGSNETAIDVFIINRSPLPVNVSRLWVTRTDLQYVWIFDSTNLPELPKEIGASEQVTIGDLDFTDVLNNNTLKSFKIDVVTDRGNKFSSQTNPLTSSSGAWQTGTMEFHIQVIVLSTQGQDRYMIEIDGIYNTTHYDFVDSATIQGQFFCVFTVPESGNYNVTVTNIKGGSTLVGYEEVILTYIYPNTYCQFDDR
ncbi:MAG: hypothetical protein NWE89_15495 [Candidatus Bathyarchaeota archaeon]|nr:hypothetical protein [Candidatus Bathyarchaeota archaeon]